MAVLFGVTKVSVCQPTFTLTDIVKRQISLRVVISVFLLLFWLVFSIAHTLYDQTKYIKNNLRIESKNIASFVVSQRLVANPEAIELFIKEYNKSHSKNSLVVSSGLSNIQEPIFSYVFPFYWTYSVPLQSLNQNFGSFIIKGSFLSDSSVVHGISMQIEFSIIFFLIVFIMLYPLVKKIPEKIFIEPIERILKSFHSDTAELSNIGFESIEIQDLKKDIQRLVKRAEQQTKEKAIVELAQQVAHDIRSPIAAISMAVSGASSMPENQRNLIESATKRLNEMANNLLMGEQYSQDGSLLDHDEPLTQESLPSLVEAVVLEKRLEYRNRDIHFVFKVNGDLDAMFAAVYAMTFQRLLSNIINNAVEAIAERGEVLVGVELFNDNIIIEVKDSGSGMSAPIIEKVMSKGFSYKKAQGSGLGLYYAKTQLERMHGRLSIQSKLGVGTTVSIALPRLLMPECHESLQCKIPRALRFSNRHEQHAIEYVLIDNDPLIREVWQQAAENAHTSFIAFPSYQEFCDNADCFDHKVIIYIDSDLADTRKGEDVAKEIYNQGFHQIYVTTGYPKKHYMAVPWISGVIGKEPPFNKDKFHE